MVIKYDAQYRMVSLKLQASQWQGQKNKKGILEKALFPIHASMLGGFVTLVIYLGLNCHHLSNGLLD
jgi:hypothetical protein